MKRIFFLLLAFVSIGLSAQVYELGGIKVDSVYFNAVDMWVDSLTTDDDLSSATDNQLPTALTIKTYVQDTVPGWIADSNTVVRALIVEKQDSLDAHTDSLQLHNTRINNNLDSIATHTDTLQLHNTRINSVLDSIAVHTDTLQSHNTRLMAVEAGGGGGGIVDTTGLPVANQITYFTAAAKIGGNSGFLFTGATRTNGAFYTGVDAPNNTTRLNFNGAFHAYNINAANNITSSVLNTSGSTRTAGYWYTGTDDPATTNRLNYNGNLHVYKLVSSSDISSGVLNSSTSIKTAGFFYLGTDNPTNTNRLNYDGALWATSFNNANASISSTGTITTPEFRVTAAGSTDIDGTLNVEGGVYFQDTVAMASYTHMYDSLYLDYLGLASGDTVALIVIDGNAVDSASLVIAAKAWVDDLIPYEQFFEQAYDHKALPLPYPDGTERRQPNAMYMAYQFEYELERLHRYMMPLYQRISLLEAESSQQKNRIYDLETEVISLKQDIADIYNLLGKKRIIKRLSK